MRIKKITKKSRNGNICSSETAAEREIKRLQASTHPLLSLAAFTRLVKEIIQEVSLGDYRIQTDAVQALREAAEALLIQLYEASYLVANHSRRMTLTVQDMQLVRRILTIFGDRII